MRDDHPASTQQSCAQPAPVRPDAEPSEPAVPEHVCAAFGIDAGSLEPGPLGWHGPGRHGSDRQAGGSNGNTASECVLVPAAHPGEAGWAVDVLDRLDLPDVDVARPARATDGRRVVGGWTAFRLPEPAAELTSCSPHELVIAGIRLHEALAEHACPDFARHRTDLCARADRIAWGEQDETLSEERGGRWFEVLAGSLRAVELPQQLVHSDVHRSLYYTSAGRPLLVGLQPLYRPAQWAIAVAVVDTLTAGEAGPALVKGWSHVSAWPQLLLRAVLFRLACHALDPNAGDAALDRLRGTAALVSEFV